MEADQEKWADEDLKYFAEYVRRGKIHNAVGSTSSNSPKNCSDSGVWEIDAYDPEVVAYHRVNAAISELAAKHPHARGIGELVCWYYYDGGSIGEFKVSVPFAFAKRRLHDLGVRFEAAGLLRDLKEIVARMAKESKAA